MRIVNLRLGSGLGGLSPRKASFVFRLALALTPLLRFLLAAVAEGFLAFFFAIEMLLQKLDKS